MRNNYVFLLVAVVALFAMQGIMHAQVVPTVTLSASNTTLEAGQSVTLYATVLDGTPPYTYSFAIFDAATNQVLNSTITTGNPVVSFPTVDAGNMTTALFANVSVVDSNVISPITFSSNPVAITVYTPPTITVSPLNSAIPLGQTQTYSVSIGGGAGPFQVELFNTTGSGAGGGFGGAQQGNVFVVSAGTQSYQINETIGYTPDQTVSLPQGYGTYLCEAAANMTFGTSAISWVNDTNDTYYSSPDTPGPGASSIGHQSDNICAASTNGAEAPGIAMAGIAINEPLNSYTVYNSFLQTDTYAPQLVYYTPNAGEFTVIMIAASAGDGDFAPAIASVALPSGCSQVLLSNNTDQLESVYIALCSNQNSGPGAVGEHGVPISYAQGYQIGQIAVSAAAYVFNSPPIDTVPATFNITAGNSVGSFAYNLIVTDGTTTPYIFNSTEIELNVNQVQSNVILSCAPLIVESSTTCTATVTGHDPMGTVTFMQPDPLIGPPVGQTGSFSGSPCTLSSGTCSATYTETDNSTETGTISAMYSGDLNNTRYEAYTEVTPSPALATTTTIPNGGGGVSSGGGGTGVGGGGSYLPSITVYLNGTQTGYTITNLTVDDFENLNFSNNTKIIHITVNFITPTSVGITANGRTYNLTSGNPVALVDPNNYTYYAELKNLPIVDGFTLLVYGQQNQPAALAQPNVTAQPPAPPSTQNVSVQKAPATTTILPTTSIPATTGIAAVAQTSAQQASSGTSDTALLLLVIVVVVAIFGYVLYQKSQKPSKQARK